MGRLKALAQELDALLSMPSMTEAETQRAADLVELMTAKLDAMPNDPVARTLRRMIEESK